MRGIEETLHPKVEEYFRTQFPDSFRLLKNVRAAEREWLTGDTSLERAIDFIIPAIQEIQQHFTASRQDNHKEFATNNSLDLVEIDTKSRKTIEDFRTGQKPLLVIPNTSLICAVFDPKVGYAVSHQALITSEALRGFSRKVLSSPGFNRGDFDVVSLLFGKKQARLEEIITPKVTSEVLAKTLEDAFGEFVEMNRRVDLAENTSLFIRGYEFAEEETRDKQLLDLTQEYLSREFNCRLDRPGIKNTQINLHMSVVVGTDHALLYGGPDHPKFSSPKDVKIISLAI